MVEERTDIELVELARNGDKNAFGLLVQRYQAPLRHFGMRLVSDDAIVEELTQEAMLQAYLSLDRLQNPARFRGWLYGILLNICRSYIRDQKGVFFSLEEMVGGLHFDSILFAGATDNPEKEAEESELHHTVLDAINSLRASDRDITLRFYYEELSLQEIAALQNVSVGAVKVRLHRARQRLKNKLMSRYPELIPITNRRKSMVKVTIYDVVKQERTDDKGRSHILYVVILLDEAGHRILPIWVGAFEGESIARGLREVPFPRPMTYNFFYNILQAIKAQVEQVRIETLKDTTFYATVSVKSNQVVSEVDARPSDALALATLTGSPVLVAEDVLERAGIDIPKAAGISAQRRGMEEILEEMEQAQTQATRTPPTEEEISRAREDLISTIFSR